MTKCTCNNCPECLPPGRIIVDIPDEDEAYERRISYEDEQDIADKLNEALREVGGAMDPRNL